MAFSQILAYDLTNFNSFYLEQEAIDINTNKSRNWH